MLLVGSITNELAKTFIEDYFSGKQKKMPDSKSDF